jgi:anti-sigma regulatory factor (Ser/Thr protein kinase)
MDTGNRHIRVFPARLSALHEIERFIVEVCVQGGVAREARFRLSVLVEELFTNTVRHGHARDTDEPVVLELETAPGRLTVTYEDTAPPHDPFTTPSRPASGEGAVGGVGVQLIAGMSTPEYRYAEGKNRITLVMPTS